MDGQTGLVRRAAVLGVGATDGAYPSDRGAPLDPQCQRLMDALLTAPGPMTVAQLGVDAEMRPNTVRFHLAHLGDAGLVSGVSARTTTRGRPGVLYRATARAFDSGPQHPRLLTEVLMHHFLADAATPPPSVEDPQRPTTVWERARRAGRAWSSHVETLPGGSPAHGGAGPEHVTDGTAQFDALLTQLGNWGLAPNRIRDPGVPDGSAVPDESAAASTHSPVGSTIGPGPVSPDPAAAQRDHLPDRIRIGLNRCPFAHEASECPDLVCGVHAGIIDGLLAQLGGSWRVARLTPHASAGQCLLDAELTHPALQAPPCPAAAYPDSVHRAGRGGTTPRA
ncbi:helix-turn-helix transcriptional regulator [Propionibacterium freudenreichii]|uniref:helix-turn-helix transcriptional regulator n=1 Tax=Propionibacterium freudenreichii TaxID=1744 RepID=UPI000543A7AD|nr:ArsR family transcriptional regulator [Propionibacterium freudenreichii]AJQ90086.1 Putative SufR family transcriptional regulator [Propionibacterium freudenreichii subsp. freudenreichii]CEG92127.1 transcriptional regulator ArsR [Propionibacterium freudenreichii]SBN43120.1 Putative SufR family transcriptional regulator [Propionibacterium freudenreichii]